MSVRPERIALAGEYLAASYLLRFCDSVIQPPPGHKADLILDHNNNLYRVQVKATKQNMSTSPFPYLTTLFSRMLLTVLLLVRISQR